MGALGCRPSRRQTVAACPSLAAMRPPVMLSEAVDEPVMTADGRERQQIWQQFYVPELGLKCGGRKGPLLYVRLIVVQ